MGFSQAGILARFDRAEAYSHIVLSLRIYHEASEAIIKSRIGTNTVYQKKYTEKPMDNQRITMASHLVFEPTARFSV